MSESKSALYKGVVRHRRFQPKEHAFSYPIFMLYLDLDELPALIKKHWFWSEHAFNFVRFKREDYFNPEISDLKEAVIQRVRQDSSPEQADRIYSVRALLHLRYLNVVFNPVVFYYCYDGDEQLLAIVAEITNTPWGERHAYTLSISGPSEVGQSSQGDIVYALRGHQKHQFEFSKQFHVSPFNPMNMDYRWVFSAPEEKLYVHMDNFIQSLNRPVKDSCSVEAKHFDATLVMSRYDLNTEFSPTLIRMPFMTVKVIWGIYWQALKLKFKGMPFYDHPDTQNT